jgi:hypothetical protein
MEEEVVQSKKPEKLSTDFDQHLKKYHAIFTEAYDRVMAEVKDEIKDAENFVTFVVRTMQAVKDADLHGWQKKEIVRDIVCKVVAAMPIEEEEKAKLRQNAVVAVDNIIDALVFAAKGYMYLRHQVEQDVTDGCVRCQTRCVGCCRNCRRAQQAKTRAGAVAVADEHLNLSGIVDDVYDTVKTIIRQKDITVGNLISIGSVIMQVVEEYPTLVGYQKKQLVLRVAHRLVDDLVSDETKQMINLAIDTTLDKSIDFIIKASRGEIEIINKIVEAVKTGCAKCMA